MFSNSLSIFILLSLSAFVVHAAPSHESCTVSVKTVTHTVTARAASTSPAHNGSGSGKGGKGGKGGKTTTKGSAHHTSSASAASPSSSGINNGSGSGNQTSTATPNNPDIQNSLTLAKEVIANGFLNNGQKVQEPGQVASLTSGNNFINFCAITLPAVPITNGLQITTGSCNPAPMGLIPSTANMPSAKFTFPKNFGSVPANQPFTISLAIQGMETGFFVNAQQNYFAAPQQLNKAGQVIGHSHVVVEALSSFTQTTPTEPLKFAFFKGLNAAAVNGILTANVTTGLPAGTYKVSSINTAANHQPVLVPIAQHGSLDDVVYFTVTDGKSTPPPPSSSSAAPPASSSAAKGGKGGKNGN